MITKLKAARLKRREDESGASMIVALFMIVVMFTFFGMAFDVMHTTYMRATLQKAVDISTAAAAAQVDVAPDGSTRIRMLNRVDPETGVTLLSADHVFKETYAVQRSQFKGMGCIEEFLDALGTCWYSAPPEQNRGVVRFEVVDSIKNLWWQWWSLGSGSSTGSRADSNIEQEVTLESQAVLRGVNEGIYGNDGEAGRRFTNPNDDPKIDTGLD